MYKNNNMMHGHAPNNNMYGYGNQYGDTGQGMGLNNPPPGMGGIDLPSSNLGRYPYDNNNNHYGDMGGTFGGYNPYNDEYLREETQGLQNPLQNNNLNDSELENFDDSNSFAVLT